MTDINTISKLTEEELLYTLEQIVRQLTYRKTTQDSALTQVDNLFELLEKKNIKTKDILQHWYGNKRYDGWYRIRKELKKLSVERIAILAQVLAVTPAYLFQLILDSYPTTEDGYDFSAYRPQVQRSMEKNVGDSNS
ncbi:hypothetical protein [Tunicatimonas pelagia]|uniref:hypothetical protein n=1 Tax=Tunicatimonas pelagia TaxID=931531 RepID=UPI0026663ED2|nr:hypothetical protein [Tunicatimonas pelagia]WKN46448.1 hypothetical protein P0M28_30835 [Tunicatimonas pelagia]